MTELTPEGRRIVEEAAHRHGISPDAVRTVLQALVASGGGMAQFDHPDLGGMGQWSRGGMIMIGDMFNTSLKARVGALCFELADVVDVVDVVDRTVVLQPRANNQWQSQHGDAGQPLPASRRFTGQAAQGDGWWPTELGSPASTGAQNSMRYAYFPERRRLALAVNGQIAVYDTGDHAISGFSQQQSGDQSVRFTSQLGLVALDSLHQVASPATATPTQPAPDGAPTDTTPTDTTPADGAPTDADAIFASIERLAGLRDKGFISPEEFAAKKADLLGRL